MPFGFQFLSFFRRAFRLAAIGRALVGAAEGVSVALVGAIEVWADWVCAMEPWQLGAVQLQAPTVGEDAGAGIVARVRTYRAVLMSADGDGERAFTFKSPALLLEGPVDDAAQALLRQLLKVDGPWSARPAYEITLARRRGDVLFVRGTLDGGRHAFLAFASAA